MTRVWIVFLCMAVIVSFILFWRISKKPVPVTQQLQPASSDLEMKGVTLTGWNGKVKQWDIHAETVESDKNQIFVRFRNIRKGTFYQDQKTTLTFQSDTAVYNSVTKDLNLTGHIQAKHADGAVLKAPELLYKGNEERLFGNKGVLVQSGKDQMEAKEITANMTLEKVTLLGGVRGHFFVEEE